MLAVFYDSTHILNIKIISYESTADCRVNTAKMFCGLELLLLSIGTNPVS